jgi:hypothetical protein
VAQAPSYTFSNNHRTFSLPDTFLKPPPISPYKLPSPHSYIRRMPLINPHEKQQQHEKFPSNDFWHQSKLTRTSPDFAYFHNLACNPCNRFPWIPIVGYAYPTSIPQQPSHSITIPPNSYYVAVNDLSTNIVKPVNTVPWYMMPVPTPTYQPYPTWIQNAVHQPLDIHATPEPSPQPSRHQRPPTTDASAVNVEGLGLSPWISEAQPIPLFHYEHHIEYPNPYEQAPALDLPHQIPQSSLPVPQIPYATGLGRFSSYNYSENDISNHLDDNKYSSSENKFSFTSNSSGTANEAANKERSQRDGNATLLRDYLTPPSVLKVEEWVHRPTESSDETQIEVKPSSLPNRGLIKETEPKNEKKKKQIQIIIPYMVNKGKPVMGKNLRDNSTVRTNLPNFVSSSTMLPLIKYLKENTSIRNNEGTDWQKLRKAIDSWTEERFSNHKYNTSVHIGLGLSTLSPSKEIPKAYLNKHAIAHRDDNNLEHGETNVIQNRVSSGMKDVKSTTASVSSIWKSVSLTESPYTKEKVFIVTPLPLTNYSYSSNDITSGNWNYL